MLNWKLTRSVPLPWHALASRSLRQELDSLHIGANENMLTLSLSIRVPNLIDHTHQAMLGCAHSNSLRTSWNWQLKDEHS